MERNKRNDGWMMDDGWWIGSLVMLGMIFSYRVEKVCIQKESAKVDEASKEVSLPCVACVLKK
jgi:hypothetical protein